MKTDDLLLAIVVGGIGLTCFYLVYQVFHWKAVKEANHLAMLQARVLYKKFNAVTHRRKRTTPSEPQ
jgi:hypothetical protein